MKIGITASTGQLGALVIEKLKLKTDSANIVALARTPERAKGYGVEVRQADYADPSTLETAFEGIDTLLLISSNEIGQRQAQHENAIEAAKISGVKRIVYTSLLRTDSTPLMLGAEHLATEKALVKSGIPYTILRNGWYTENYAASVTGAAQNGVIIGAAGDAKISSAARADYAEAAAVALTQSGHEGKTYELAGDEAYTLAELAAEVGKQLGKPISYINLTEDEYAAKLAGFGLPEPVAKVYAHFDAATAEGALFDDGKALSKLIGHPTTSLAAVVSQILSANS